MKVFEIIIILLLLGCALAALSKKIGSPYPALVALAGAALAFVPGVPMLSLDPELALALFIAPVLLDAAYDASPRDLHYNWRPVASLAVGAVILTVIIVAVVAHAIVPDLPWAAAIALGAIVSPPDAAAASAVLKHLKPPHRILVILGGESLFNDASALLIFRAAVAATVSGVFSTGAFVQSFVVVAIGSVVLGFILAKVMTYIASKIDDTSIAIVVQFCGTFAVWLIAEKLHLSEILTMVIFAMVTARKAPEVLQARMRIPTWAVWQVAVFVLNVLAFMLVGFQLRSIIERMNPNDTGLYLIVSASIGTAAIMARIAWVMGSTVFRHWRVRYMGPRKKYPDNMNVTYAGAAVVSWSGMRGTVTLATALALPFDFPYHDLIVATAFAVTLSTLVIQGMTLKPLLKFFKLKDDGTVDGEVLMARAVSLKAGLKAISQSPQNETTLLVKQTYQLQFDRAEKEAAKKSENTSGEALTKKDEEKHLKKDFNENGVAIYSALKAQRHALVILREERVIGHAAFQTVEEELDWMELGWSQLLPTSKKQIAESL